MKKYLFFCLLLMTGSLWAQTSAITATITDPDSQTWNNGTYLINFVPAPNTQQPSTWSGGTLVTQYSGSLSSGGVLSVSIADNNYITPPGSLWQFQLCSNSSAPCQSVKLKVTGATPNLSTALSSALIAPRFNAGQFAYGYLDLEVVTPVVTGSTYYNATNSVQRIWSGSAWGNNGTGGSGTVTSVGSGAGLTGGPITTSGTLSIATGGVTNAMLANSGITIAGTSISLGGNTTSFPSPGTIGGTTPGIGDFTVGNFTTSVNVGSSLLYTAGTGGAFVAGEGSAPSAFTSSFATDVLYASSTGLCLDWAHVTSGNALTDNGCLATTAQLVPAFPITVTGGVSGGIPCFTSTTTESSSGLLTANAVMIGGGPGACPTTNSYAVFATNSFTLGGTTTASGAVTFNGGTSGSASIGAAAVAGSTSQWLMPTTDPTNGQVLTASTPVGGKETLSWATPTTGTVTMFSAGNLSPLFTTSVANATTTPALTFTLSTQTQNTVFGAFTSTTPAFNALASCSGNNDAEIYTTNTGLGCGTNFAQLNVAESFSALQTFGSNASIAATAHGVLLSENTSAVVATAVGATNQVLNGNTGADPTWGAVPLGALPNIPINDVISATGAIATIADGNNPLVINCALTSGTTCLTTGETTAATTAGAVELQVSTLTTSTAIPVQISQGAAGPAASPAPAVFSISSAAAGGAAAASGAGQVGAAISLLSGNGSTGGATTGNGGAGGGFSWTGGNGGLHGGTSGNSGGNGGGWASTTGNGGAGNTTGTTGGGGSAVWTMGAAAAVASTGSGATNGIFQITSSQPGASASATQSNNAGNMLTVSAVQGGNNTNAAGTAGTGSSVSMTGGTGGNGTGTNAVGGTGGGFAFTAGGGGTSNGTGANANGGNFTVSLGPGGTGGSGITGAPGQVQISGTSVTGSLTTPVLNITNTWNTTGADSGVIFTNTTNTASASGSATFNQQLGGTEFIEFLTQSSTPATAATDGPNLALGGSSPEITTPGTTPFLNMNTLVNEALSTCHITAAITLTSQTTICLWTLPNTVKAWSFQCEGSYTTSTTAISLTLGSIFAQAPSTGYGDATIGTGLAGTSTSGGATNTGTTAVTILAGGSVASATSNVPWAASGTFTGSATSGTFILYGTASTSSDITIRGNCTLQ